MRTRSSFKEFLERWFFPYTLLVLLYLLFCGIVCFVYRDTGGAIGVFILVAYGSGEAYEPLYKLTLVDFGLFFLVLQAFFPSRIIDLWDGRWVPRDPPGKRRAVLIGYFSTVIGVIAAISWVLLMEPPHSVFAFFFPKVLPCLLYLYFCAVANYPFRRKEEPLK